MAIGRPYRDEVLLDEPVMAYLFGNNDSSRYYNHAERSANTPTTTGTASSDVYDAPPLYNPSFTTNQVSAYFDCTATTGRPYIQIPYFSARNVDTPEISFECLFKQSSRDGTTAQFFYISDDIGLNGTRERIQFAVRDNGSVAYGGIQGGDDRSYTVAPVGAIQLNTLYHLVVTIDNQVGGAVKCYINGVEQGQGATLTHAVGAGGTTSGLIGGTRTVGGTNTGIAGNYFNGTIHGLAQYDKILTQDDVTRHYQSIQNKRIQISPNDELQRDYVSSYSPNALYTMGGWETGSTTNGFNDLSGNGNNGTSFGDVQESVSSLSFSGNSSLFIPNASTQAGIRIPYSSTMRVTGGTCTLSGWFSAVSFTEDQPNRVSQTPQILSIGDNGGIAAGQFQCCLRTNANRMSILKYVSGSTTETILSDDYDTPLNVGEPHFFAVTVDGTSVDFYLDGIKVGATKTASTAIPDRTSGDSFIGCSTDTVTPTTKGAYGFIDEVAFFDSILSPAQILSIYNLRGALVVSNLDDYVARWSFDTGLSNPIPDATNYYSFNDTPNDQIGSVNWTLNGGLGYSTGKINNGLDVSTTSQYAVIPEATSTPEFFASQTWSISFWFNADETNFGTIIQTEYVDLTNTTLDGWRFRYDGSGNLSYSEYTNYDYVSVSGYNKSIGSSAWGTVQVGQWQHVVISRTPTEVKGYLNGELIGSITSGIQDIGYRAGLCDFAIGGRRRSTGFQVTYDGQFDELHIFDRGLTDGEARALYLATETNNQSATDFALNHSLTAGLDGAIVGFINNPPTPTTDPTDYVSFWGLSADGSDATGTNNGTLVNAPASVADRNGNAGGARDFNGTNQRVDIPTSATLNTSAFTISTWIKTTDTNGGRRIFSNSRNNPNTFGYTFTVNSAGKLGGGIYDGTGFNINAPIESTTVVTDNVWHYVVLTYDGTNTKVYVDGILEDTTTPTASIVHTSSQFVRIACQNVTGVNTNYLDASIDDVKFYDRALTDGEVAAQYLVDRTFGGRTTGYDGDSDGALSFTGVDQYVDLPDDAIFDDQTFSVSAWAKTSTLTDCIIFANAEGGTSREGYRVRFDGYDWGSGGSFWNEIRDPSASSFLNEWCHIAVTCGGLDDTRFYRNGVVILDPASIQAPQFGSNQDVFIGASANTSQLQGAQQFFTGELDDVRFYDRKLNSNEVFYLARTSIPPKPQDMIAEYKLENNGVDSISGRDFGNILTPQYTTGWEGQCYSSSTSGLLIQSANVSAFELQTFSISVFIKSNVASQANNESYIISNGYFDATGPTRYGWSLITTDSNGGKLTFQVFDGTGQGGSSRDFMTSGDDDPKILNTDTWIHVVVTVTPSGMAMYLDGKLSASVAKTNVPTIVYHPSLNLMCLGAERDSFGGTNRVWDGEIDEFRIYDRELIN